jgi:hypothetical protein
VVTSNDLVVAGAAVHPVGTRKKAHAFMQKAVRPLQLPDLVGTRRSSVQPLGDLFAQLRLPSGVRASGQCAGDVIAVVSRPAIRKSSTWLVTSVSPAGLRRFQRRAASNRPSMSSADPFRRLGWRINDLIDNAADLCQLARQPSVVGCG